MIISQGKIANVIVDTSKDVALGNFLYIEILLTPGLTHYNFSGFALGSCYPSLLV
jgi:hypothetical protein